MPWPTFDTLRHGCRETQLRFPLLLPVLAWLLLTLVLHSSGLDLWVSAQFFDTDTQSWPAKDRQPWEAIDEYCVFPGLILGLVALVWMVHGLIWRQRIRGFWVAGILATTILIGPGLLVNGMMKPGFSRPRPRQITQFAGTQQHQPPFGWGEEFHFNASFPSGHASIGFFLITPAICLLAQSTPPHRAAGRWSGLRIIDESVADRAGRPFFQRCVGFAGHRLHLRLGECRVVAGVSGGRSQGAAPAQHATNSCDATG